MKTGVVAITRGGKNLAAKLCALLDDATLLEQQPGEKIAQVIAANWQRFDSFICIMAAGIVVRAIAPVLKDKLTDPCVVVLDEKGCHAISLLAGHIGGGNELAGKVAELLGGTAVITTASDTLGLAALDTWAKEQDLYIPNRKELTNLSTRLVNRRQLFLYADVQVSSLPNGIIQSDDSGQSRFYRYSFYRDGSNLPDISTS